MNISNFGSESPSFSVKSLSFGIKKILESSYSKIYVKGCVSQPKRMNHLYFSLKEDDAVIDCVAWANVKLKFEPKHDMEILCCGRISVYPGRSKYQLVVLSVEYIGDSQILEKRRLMLQKEGLFDAAKKLPLPKYPKRVGIITSPMGAVLHDMLHRLHDRYPCEVIFYPVTVQGPDMAENVIQAIEYFNKCNIEMKKSDTAVLDDLKLNQHVVDLLIVARGGGSFEDLWGFQDENLVRCIAKSTIPIVTAIGHETDTTLSDYASACRAPTPTAAIELAFPDKKDLYSKLDYLLNTLKHKTKFVFENKYKNRVNSIHIRPLHDLLNKFKQKLQNVVDKTGYTYKIFWSNKSNAISNMDKIKIDLTSMSEKLRNFSISLENRQKQFLDLKSALLGKMESDMKNISYENTLKRGFCRAHIDGKLIKSKNDAPEKFALEFVDGSVNVEKSKT